MDTNYYETAAVFTVSLVATIASYFAETGSYYIYGIGAASVIFAVGVTAYITDVEFNAASLASTAALVMAPLNVYTFFTGMFLATVLPLTSFFKSGESFTDIYSAVSISILIGSVIIGVTTSALLISGLAGDQAVNKTSSTVTSIATTTTESLGIGKTAQSGLEETAVRLSRATIQQTRKIVLAEAGSQLDNQEIESINNGFNRASSTIPESVRDNLTEQASVDLESRMKQALNSVLTGREWVIGGLISALLIGLRSFIGVGAASSTKLMSLIHRVS